MKKNIESIAKRFDKVMDSIGCEHLCITDENSEVLSRREAYGIDHITIKWMRKEAEYWLSCYYDEDNCRCNERHDSPEDYKIWVSETGKLKRLIKALEQYDEEIVVVE